MLEVACEKMHGIWFAIAVNPRKRVVACSLSDRSAKDAWRSLLGRVPRNVKVKSGARFSKNFPHRIRDAFNVKDFVYLKSLDLSRLSPFRKKVLMAVARIPRGRVATYAALAESLGSRNYARAVGRAVAGNPFPIAIPCHRVVPSSLTVGCYSVAGRKPVKGGHVKHMLLERESVQFNGDKVSERSLWYPC